jgi:hypothetical protein
MSAWQEENMECASGKTKRNRQKPKTGFPYFSLPLPYLQVRLALYILEIREPGLMVIF